MARNDRSSGEAVADQRGGRHGRAAQDPGAIEDDQGQALHRQPARPIGNGRQKKAGNDGGGVPEDHLMGMPDRGSESRRYRDGVQQHRKPEGDTGDTPDAGAQEERTEALTKDLRAAEWSIAGYFPGSGTHLGSLHR
jgi:hypothetical protein